MAAVLQHNRNVCLSTVMKKIMSRRADCLLLELTLHVFTPRSASRSTSTSPPRLHASKPHSACVALLELPVQKGIGGSRCATLHRRAAEDVGESRGDAR